MKTCARRETPPSPRKLRSVLIVWFVGASKTQERKYYWSSKFSFLVVNAHRVKELPLLPYLRLIPVSKCILFLVAFSGSNRRIPRIIQLSCKSVPSFHCFQMTFVAFFCSPISFIELRSTRTTRVVKRSEVG